MSVKEVLGSLGSWSVQVSDELPEEHRAKIDFFGHIVILRGDVEIDSHDDAALLRAARYVGVTRSIDLDERHELGGSSMVFWLGDEDDKGEVFETPIVLTNASLGACLTAILPDALTVGTVFDPGGTFTGKFQFVTPRVALQTITDHFGVEARVNGDGTVDVGTQAQLFESVPDSVVVRRGAGTDMDAIALGARFATQKNVDDYSTRIVLVGESDEAGQFAIGSQSAPAVPYFDLFGNPVKRTRLISETGTPTGTVAQRTQLHLNRFSRVKTSLKVTADEYEIEGNFVVGDMTDAYDPETGLVDANRERYFRGDLLHPVLIRISELSWSITGDHTVAFRTGSGEWIDLTRWVEFENGSNEIVVGDLPKTLTSPTSNPVLDRADSLPDGSIPNPPTNLQLATTSFVNPTGQNGALVLASWDAPTQNADGTVLNDLSHYLVQWRPSFRAPLWNVSYSDVTELDLPATVDLGYDVRVAAVDKAGNTSDYTSVVSITAGKDVTAPAAPSDPLVSSYIGQLRVEWDGLTSTGGSMPPDFNRVDVHVSAVSGFVPSTATLIASLSTKGVAFATAPYGSPRYVRLVAYDHNGNPSTASGQVTGTTQQAGDGDIAALNVGKLVAGIMVADVTISGRFATALTGARTELNALGLQKWDASNNLLVSITGTEALLTGTYKTALTGRRIEIGSAGTAGEVNFFAPDNTKAQIKSWTEGTGVEAIQMGVILAGVNNSLWNKINYNSDEWANYRAENHDFGMLDSGFFIVRSYADRVVGTTPRTRFYIDTSNAYFRGTDGNVRLWVNDGATEVHYSRFSVHPFEDNASEDGWFEVKRTEPGHGSTTSSALLSFVNPSNFGALLKFNAAADGSSGRLEVRDINDNNYFPIYASAFTVSSDESTKESISDLTGSDLVRSMRPRTYRLKGENRTRLGLVAQEAPAEIVVPMGVEDEILGVDLYAMVTALVADAHEKEARLAALERGRP